MPETSCKNCRLVWSEQQIQERVENVALSIFDDFLTAQTEALHTLEEDKLVVIGILNGCVFFFADLVRYMELPFEMDFAKISSWDNATKHNDRKAFVDVLSLPKIDVKGKYVILVDDILDTGGAMEVLQRWAKGKGAKVIKIAVLLDKPANRTALDQFTGKLITPDYAGFSNVEPCFYFGYGMDMHGVRVSTKHIYALIDPDKPAWILADETTLALKEAKVGNTFKADSVNDLLNKLNKD